VKSALTEQEISPLSAVYICASELTGVPAGFEMEHVRVPARARGNEIKNNSAMVDSAETVCLFIRDRSLLILIINNFCLNSSHEE
jgi:hypothetical protein